MQNLKKNWLEEFGNFFFEWCKIWNRIVLPFQNWHEKFNKFWPKRSKISKIFSLMCWFWPKYIMLQPKKVQSSYVWLHSQGWHKVWRKTGLCFRKLSWGIWQILNRALESLQIGTLVASWWAWNLKGSYVSWQWKMMQKLKRNWLVSSKLTWRIWQILTRALENLKNLHFNPSWKNELILTVV